MSRCRRSMCTLLMRRVQRRTKRLQQAAWLRRQGGPAVNAARCALGTLRLWAHGLRRSLELTEALHAEAAKRRRSFALASDEPMVVTDGMYAFMHALQLRSLLAAALRTEVVASGFRKWQTWWSVRHWQLRFVADAESMGAEDEATGAEEEDIELHVSPRGSDRDATGDGCGSGEQRTGRAWSSRGSSRPFSPVAAGRATPATAPGKPWPLVR